MIFSKAQTKAGCAKKAKRPAAPSGICCICLVMIISPRMDSGQRLALDFSAHFAPYSTLRTLRLSIKKFAFQLPSLLYLTLPTTKSKLRHCLMLILTYALRTLRRIRQSNFAVNVFTAHRSRWLPAHRSRTLPKTNSKQIGRAHV